MSHPDGQIALLSGSSEITGHFTSPPFQFNELAHPNIHRVLNSYDVLGGPATFNVVWTSSKFHDENPKVYAAFVKALDEAEAMVNKASSRGGADVPADEQGQEQRRGDRQDARRPDDGVHHHAQNTMKYVDFMAQGRRDQGQARVVEGDVLSQRAGPVRKLTPHSRAAAAPTDDEPVMEAAAHPPALLRPRRPRRRRCSRCAASRCNTRRPKHLVTATYRVDFEVFQCDRFVLLGPSGCGKSTLLKAVGGYLRADRGRDPPQGQASSRGPGPTA